MKLKVVKLKKDDKNKFGYYNPYLWADNEETIELLSNILDTLECSIVEETICFEESCSTIEEAEKIAMDYKKHILKELKK